MSYQLALTATLQSRGASCVGAVGARVRRRTTEYAKWPHPFPRCSRARQAVYTSPSRLLGHAQLCPAHGERGAATLSKGLSMRKLASLLDAGSNRPFSEPFARRHRVYVRIRRSVGLPAIVCSWRRVGDRHLLSCIAASPRSCTKGYVLMLWCSTGPARRLYYTRLIAEWLLLTARSRAL